MFSYQGHVKIKMAVQRNLENRAFELFVIVVDLTFSEPKTYFFQ